MDIRIVVSRRRAILPDSGDYLVGDNKGDRILVEFDEEWDEYTVKTARFHYNGTSEDVVFSGGEVEIPRLRNTSLLEVGFYAGDLRTSTPVQIKVKRSAVEKEGLPPDPTPDVYAQLTELIKSGSIKGAKGDKGDPYTLTEEDKTTIVSDVLSALPTWEGGSY